MADTKTVEPKVGALAAGWNWLTETQAWTSVFRHGRVDNDRNRVLVMLSNVFQRVETAGDSARLLTTSVAHISTGTDWVAALSNGTAVRGEAADGGLPRPHIEPNIIAKQVAKSHGLPNLLTSPRRGEVEAEAPARLRVRGLSTRPDSHLTMRVDLSPAGRGEERYVSTMT